MNEFHEKLAQQELDARAMDPNAFDVTKPVGRCVAAARVLGLAIDGNVTAETAIMILTEEPKNGR